MKCPPPAWLLKVLEEKCSTYCLDTPEERLVVANAIHEVMAEEIGRELGLTVARPPAQDVGHER